MNLQANVTLIQEINDLRREVKNLQHAGGKPGQKIGVAWAGSKAPKRTTKEAKEALPPPPGCAITSDTLVDMTICQHHKPSPSPTHHEHVQSLAASTCMREPHWSLLVHVRKSTGGLRVHGTLVRLPKPCAVQEPNELAVTPKYCLLDHVRVSSDKQHEGRVSSDKQHEVRVSSDKQHEVRVFSDKQNEVKLTAGRWLQGTRVG